MKNALIALLLLSALALSAHAAYTQNVIVQVFDQDFRPVEGALVYSEHQLNAITGNVKDKPKPTNISGLYGLKFTVYEEIEAEVDYTYTLYVKYGDQLVKATLEANPNVTRVYTMRVDSYFAFVRVHDQLGKPQDATVTVSGGEVADQTKQTTDTGDAVFQLPPGSYSLRVVHNGNVKNKDFTLAKDAALDVIFGNYALDAKVVDDRKKPLLATVQVGTQEAETDGSGNARLVNISDEAPSVVVKYADRYKTYKPNLALGETLLAVFDLSKPDISDLHASISDSGGATITFFASDTGSAASGIDTVTVTYDVAGVEYPIPAYSVAYNTFEAKIPAQEPGTLVKYTVKLADKDGNAALGRGSYSVSGSSAPAPSPTPAPAPSPIPTIPASTGGIPTEMLVLLAFAGLIVAYAVFYYFKRRRDEGLGKVAPPSVPPQPPKV